MVKKVKEAPKPDPREGQLLSLGSTLVNLALSGRARGVPLKGKYLYLVGDSASGKTWFTLALLAEAARNPSFQDHRLIFDDVENGALMELERCFGAKLADRLEPPALDKEGVAKPSRTIEDFYYNLDDALEEGKPFVYVVDSMDALGSEDEEKRFKKDKARYRKGKGDAAGSFGDGKAKKNSQNLRRLVRRLEKTDSLLVVISQTRDNLNAGPFGDPKTRGGGKALKFYAHGELWTSVGKPIKRRVRDKERRIGDRIIVKVKKNRFSGRLNVVETAIYPGYGIDDLGSCVDFLLAEKFWSKGTGKKKGLLVTGEAFGDVARRDLLKQCDEDPKVTRSLQQAVATAWRELEKACSLERKPRYE